MNKGTQYRTEKAKLKLASWEYLCNNFHKFSEDNKVKIALKLVTSEKKPKIYENELYGWVKDIIKRDGFKCTKCGGEEKLQVHHIKSFRNFPDLLKNESNVETLCFKCHKKTDNYAGKSRLNMLV